MVMHYKLADGFSNCEELALNICDLFDGCANSLYKGRNELKIVPFDGRNYVVKSFKQPRLLHRFIYTHLRESKARRSFEYSFALLERSIKVPQPVAFIECMDNGLLTRSFFISEQCPHDYTIRELLDQEWPDKQVQLEQFVEHSYHVHQQGVLHLDYSPGNVLVKKEAPGAWAFSLVDLNRMKFRKVDFHRGLYNFVRLINNQECSNIIARKYASCSQQEPEEAISTLWKYKQRYEGRRNFRLKAKRLVLRK